MDKAEKVIFSGLKSSHPKAPRSNFERASSSDLYKRVRLVEFDQNLLKKDQIFFLNKE